MSELTFKVHLPYSCLFDLRWGFVRKHTTLDEFSLFSSFNDYCGRTIEDVTRLYKDIPTKFKIDKDVVRLSPRTAILTVITNAYRQFNSDHPDDSVKLHIDLNFSEVAMIPNSIRREICDTLVLSTASFSKAATVTPISTPYSDMKIKHLRKRYKCLIVYDLKEFISIFNPNTPAAYGGIGIITRPFFKNGAKEFVKLVTEHEKYNNKGETLDKGDHYDILSDIFAHLGPIHFHQPEFFSAINPT